MAKTGHSVLRELRSLEKVQLRFLDVFLSTKPENLRVETLRCRHGVCIHRQTGDTSGPVRQGDNILSAVGKNVEDLLNPGIYPLTLRISRIEPRTTPRSPLILDKDRAVLLPYDVVVNLRHPYGFELGTSSTGGVLVERIFCNETDAVKQGLIPGSTLLAINDVNVVNNACLARNLLDQARCKGTGVVRLHFGIQVTPTMSYEPLGSSMIYRFSSPTPQSSLHCT